MKPILLLLLSSIFLFGGSQGMKADRDEEAERNIVKRQQYCKETYLDKGDKALNTVTHPRNGVYQNLPLASACYARYTICMERGIK